MLQKHSPLPFSLAESPEIGPSVVVHTTVAFGHEHLDSDPEEVQQIILSHLQRIVPSLPKPSSIKCQRWRYSQVLSREDLLGLHFPSSGKRKGEGMVAQYP